MTARVPPGCRRRCASFKMLCRPLLGASWKAYMTVTKSKDLEGSSVSSALARVKLVVHGGQTKPLGRRRISALTKERCLVRKLAMDIISEEVSTPTTVSACGNALRRARVEMPTPQQRSTTRAWSVYLTRTDSS